MLKITKKELPLPATKTLSKNNSSAVLKDLTQDSNRIKETLQIIIDADRSSTPSDRHYIDIARVIFESSEIYTLAKEDIDLATLLFQFWQTTICDTMLTLPEQTQHIAQHVYAEDQNFNSIFDMMREVIITHSKLLDNLFSYYNNQDLYNEIFSYYNVHGYFQNIVLNRIFFNVDYFLHDGLLFAQCASAPKKILETYELILKYLSAQQTLHILVSSDEVIKLYLEKAYLPTIKPYLLNYIALQCVIKFDKQENISVEKKQLMLAILAQEKKLTPVVEILLRAILYQKFKEPEYNKQTIIDTLSQISIVEIQQRLPSFTDTISYVAAKKIEPFVPGIYFETQQDYDKALAITAEKPEDPQNKIIRTILENYVSFIVNKQEPPRVIPALNVQKHNSYHSEPTLACGLFVANTTPPQCPENAWEENEDAKNTNSCCGCIIS